MNEQKIKKIPKAEVEKVRDHERGIEVNFMILLIKKYPDKAAEAVKSMKRRDSFLLTKVYF